MFLKMELWNTVKPFLIGLLWVLLCALALFFSSVIVGVLTRSCYADDLLYSLVWGTRRTECLAPSEAAASASHREELSKANAAAQANRDEADKQRKRADELQDRISEKHAEAMSARTADTICRANLSEAESRVTAGSRRIEICEKELDLEKKLRKEEESKAKALEEPARAKSPKSPEVERAPSTSPPIDSAKPDRKTVCLSDFPFGKPNDQVTVTVYSQAYQKPQNKIATLVLRQNRIVFCAPNVENPEAVDGYRVCLRKQNDICKDYVARKPFTFLYR